MKCHIIVLEYNGPDLLTKCLPSIADAVKRSQHTINLTILDNGCDPKSALATKEFAPLAHYVKSKQNRILCSFNDYAEQLDDEYLLFMNNDILVDEGFIDPLIKALDSNPKNFFAAPLTKEIDTGIASGGIAKLSLKWGLPACAGTFTDYRKTLEKPSLTIQTGFGLFRRDLFLKLNGYDDLYLPGTIEDLDLCYRGYRSGYEGRYCPDSIVYHIGQVSFKREFGESGIRRVNRRNLFLFVWKNIRDPWILCKHVLCLPLQIIKYILLGQYDFVIGFVSALRLLPRALKRRALSSNEKSIMSDHHIFNLAYGDSDKSAVNS
jgi:GT2 family glycosyltransferase